MFWLIIVGIFVALTIASGVSWHTIDRVGSSTLPGYIKFLIIAAIVVGCFALLVAL